MTDRSDAARDVRTAVRTADIARLTPPDPRRRMEAPAPPTSARTPRAALTLPANPFGDLEAQDLSSFVECTLYETGDDADTDPDFPIYVAAPDRPAPRYAATPPRAAPRPAPTAVTRAASPTAAARSSKRAAHGPALALCAAGAFIGLGAATVLRWPSAIADQRDVVRPTAQPAAPGATPPARPPRPPEPPAPVVEPIAPGIEAEGRAALPVVAAAAPMAAAAEPAAEEELVPRKKTATLIIGSSPRGAEIAVNGEPLGIAPTRLEVPRYEEVEIRATLAGYVPWKKTIYVRRAETRVGTSLTPVKTEPADEDEGPADDGQADEGPANDGPAGP